MSAVDVRIPTLGESITEGVIVRWIKDDGAAVRTDDALLELETDKASVEIPAEQAGVLRILKAAGSTVQVGDVVGRIDDGAGAQVAESATPTPAAPDTQHPTPDSRLPLSPAVRRLVEEHHLDPRRITATGRGGRLTKEDVLAHLAAPPRETPAVAAGPAVPDVAAAPPEPAPTRFAVTTPGRATDDEERVAMTPLRQRVAQRLVDAQRTAAILTTFNEVDMSAVMALRARHKAQFADKHGVGLGMMSFFARACVGALRDVPAVNAQIDGTDIVYKKRVHLGVAVATERGLVVPIVHDADQLSFAGIEKEIERLAGLARQNKLSVQDLSGGTFTITNGGVFGSLLSTPILNPPQSAILGMHKIEKRAVVVDDAVVVRPMMYLALSYDHRLIDGQQAVTFLIRVKERIEDPTRLLLDL
jgi:2-oxoglutarate dehydrogenase E2 component (dihydrolipoamide succinyltransferase)